MRRDRSQAARGRALRDPYDQGYRDGWHDIHRSHQPGRKRRRRQDQEYALGYDHGRTDGLAWGQFDDWYPDFQTGPTGDPQPFAWRRDQDGNFSRT